MDPKHLIGIKDPTGQAPFFHGLRGTLLGWFILLAIVPMVLVIIISYNRAQKALTESAAEKLVAIREIRKDIVLTLFGRWNSEILFVSQLEALKSDIVDMAAGFNYLGPDRLKSLYFAKPELMDAEDGSAYSAVHNEEHRFFKSYTKIQQHEDVLLIDLAGNVIYTEQKGAGFGVSLTSEPYQATNLARLYQGLKTAKLKEVLVVDAAIFENEVAMFMGTPVYREDVCLGYFAFQLPLKYLSQRMGRRESTSSTRGAYLVGPDLRMRSDSFNDPINRTVKASFSGMVSQNWIDAEGVREGLDGKSDVHSITDYRGKKALSAYAPLVVNGLQWVILSEVDMEEAMAPTVTLAKITAGLTVAVALLVLMLSLLVSGRIARPLQKLEKGAELIGKGNFDVLIPVTSTDELGKVSREFNLMALNLKQSRDRDEAQKWIKQGISLLDDKIRGKNDLDSLGREIVNFICNNLNAHIGLLYINDGTEIYKLSAGFAVNPGQKILTEFRPEQGLIGQCTAEKKSRHISDLPQEYFIMSSALGEISPRQLSIIPFIYNDTVEGIIELGLFESLSDRELQFLDEASGRIAVVINSVRSRADLNNALNITIEQKEELQRQQEELQAANEELEEQTQLLSASEETLKQQQEELQAANEELEEKTEFLERNKKQVEEKNQKLEQMQQVLNKKAEDLAVASRYKSEFLANMSHELRTPLNSLLLLAKLLSDNKEKNLTKDQLESAGIIFNSGRDLLSLINEILDLSKIEAGKMVLDFRKVLINDLANNIKIYFLRLAEEKGLVLDVTINKNCQVSITSDVKRIEQILKNLIFNAIKFTNEGSIHIEFYNPEHGINFLREGLNGKKVLAISVKDTGIGILEEKQKIIFQAFHQIEEGISRKYSGTGLGLSISSELANLLGGEIQLESKTGQGSVFILYLPVEQEPAILRQTESEGLSVAKLPEMIRKPLLEKKQPAPAEISIPDDRDTIKKSDKTLLIIEDDIHFGKVLLQFCRKRGFKCLFCTTGENGLFLAQKYVPKAIILDIRLPGIDGWAVFDALKANQTTRHIPVHFMSVDEPLFDTFKKGAIGYLTKPVSQEKLEQALEKIESMINKKMKELLIVEDNDVQRKMIRKLIGNGDVVCDEAVNGTQAITALTSKNYDCMILDLGLPDMTGFELLEKMQKNTKLKLPPVVVYTGKDLSIEEETMLRTYSESIVIKGVRSEERLLDETSLFLHRMIGILPEEKKQMIADIHDSDQMFRDKTILIVDDDMRNVFALSKVLNQRGLKIIKAENGKKALTVLEEQTDIDLVLMDIMMPVMDGFEAMKNIRLNEKFRQLPIIALTAKAMRQDKENCIQAGANDYLPKPVDIERLLSMMRIWLYR